MKKNKKLTDPKTESRGVSEPLLDKTLTGSPVQYRTGRLYQFSTKENYRNEIIFGTIFELGYQKESKDLETILNKIEKELKHLDKIAENETEQGKLVINKAKENIQNMSVWKLEQFTTDEGLPYIQKLKIGNYEQIKQGVENAKKSK